MGGEGRDGGGAGVGLSGEGSAQFSGGDDGAAGPGRGGGGEHGVSHQEAGQVAGPGLGGLWGGQPALCRGRGGEREGVQGGAGGIVLLAGEAGGLRGVDRGTQRHRLHPPSLQCGRGI